MNQPTEYMRFEGSYAVKSAATYRAERLARAHVKIERTKKIAKLVFWGLVAAFFVYLLIGLLAVGFETPLLPILIALGILAAGGLSQAMLFVVDLSHGGYRKQYSKKFEIMTNYLRARMRDLLGNEMQALKHEDKKIRDTLIEAAKSYIASYQADGDTYRRLMERGNLIPESQKILDEYTRYLKELQTEEGKTYLVHRENLAKLIEKWRNENYHKYDKTQQKRIDSNIGRLFQEADSDRETFVRSYGVVGVLDVAERLAVYRNPDPKKCGVYDNKPLPNATEAAAFRDLIAEIKAFDLDSVSLVHGGSDMQKYKDLLDSYENALCHRCWLDFPEIKVKKCREALERAVKDRTVCRFCRREYNTRYKKVCRNCGHYICLNCNKCFCNRKITRKIVDLFSDN